MYVKTCDIMMKGFCYCEQSILMFT